jgi:hypothetical protein
MAFHGTNAVLPNPMIAKKPTTLCYLFFGTIRSQLTIGIFLLITSALNDEDKTCFILIEN